MIYARFWVKVLNDMGMIGFREPFGRFFSNGWVTMGGKTKMSKRAGNVVSLDEFVARLRRRHRRASTSSSSVPPTRTWSGPRTGSRGCRGSCAACGGS